MDFCPHWGPMIKPLIFLGEFPYFVGKKWSLWIFTLWPLKGCHCKLLNFFTSWVAVFFFRQRCGSRDPSHAGGIVFSSWISTPEDREMRQCNPLALIRYHGVIKNEAGYVRFGAPKHHQRKAKRPNETGWRGVFNSANSVTDELKM